MTTAAIPNYPKRTSNRDAILALLSDGWQHHMSELIRVGGYRYGGRIFELRKKGYDIETIAVGKDEFAYRMHIDGRQLALKET
ncbi:MAG: hypothetical protein M3P06_11570 [Acidobacteriota bacterium]|nr:hypothetical protein [Acidobacteriota bacterium]